MTSDQRDYRKRKELQTKSEKKGMPMCSESKTK